MKFGKHIRRVRDVSYDDWRAFWMDYKMLKRLIKPAATHKESSVPLRPATPQALASVPEERAFFAALLQNLRKVNAFYDRQVTLMGTAVASLAADTAETARVPLGTMTRCRNTYKRLLMLENFVVVNYCGFSKILKKHDKNTGWATREPYMSRMVNPLPFTHYLALRRLIAAVEDTFQRLTRAAPASAAHDRPRLQSEDERALRELACLRGETAALPTAGGPGLSIDDDEVAVAFACQGLGAAERAAVRALAAASARARGCVDPRPSPPPLGAAAPLGPGAGVHASMNVAPEVAQAAPTAAAEQDSPSTPESSPERAAMPPPPAVSRKRPAGGTGMEALSLMAAHRLEQAGRRSSPDEAPAGKRSRAVSAL